MNQRLPVILALLPAMLTSAQDDAATLDTQTAREQLASAITAMETDPQSARSALERIAERVSDDDLRAAAIYNNAVLAKREGRAEDALASFNEARSIATDPTLRRDALSNVAHLHAARGEPPSDQPPTLESLDAAIESLKLAERAFLDASRTDPSHAQSIRNLQRTRQKLRELERQREQLEQHQNQQQQGDQGQQNQNSDQLQQLADQQREQAQQSENAQSQDQSQEQRQERQQQQQDLREQTQQARQQMEESLDEQTREDLQRAQDAQQRAQEALEQGDDEQAAQAQQEAAQALDQAAQRQREQESQGQQQNDQQQQSEAEPDEQVDPRDSIDELAQRLLDKERRERERRSLYRQGGQPVRVEEDW